MTARKPLICTSITAATKSALEAVLRSEFPDADLLELRLDYLAKGELAKVAASLDQLLESAPLPVIVTLRPADQGGASSANVLTDVDRLEFWRTRLPLSSGYYDLELDTVSALASGGVTPEWDRIICSHHEFESVPGDLESILERMQATPAGILKIAVMTSDAIDCLPIFQLLERAQLEGRRIIAIGMGPAGIPTRVLGPSRGSFLTYGALSPEQATASGQITAAELNRIYRIHQIDSQTQIMGIIGEPVGHSLSPRIHNAAFAAANLNAVYLPFHVRDLGAFMKRMADPRTREIDWRLRGLSVTAPHKTAVMGYLDWIDPVSESVGAVNTILIEDDRMLGYNTDSLGFSDSLASRNTLRRGFRVAIIGAGGAARAVLWSLRNNDAESVVFSRDAAKGRMLANEFGATSRELDGAAFAGFDLVVNTTPLGAFGPLVKESPANSEQLRGARLVYDLVYNPGETQLLREAREAGCETVGGLSMLVSQAMAQFKLWTGVDASRTVMDEAVSQPKT